jgi:probable rRNA maturation factor
MSHEISLSNEQSRHSINETQLIDAARAVLADSSFSSAMISLVVGDDAAMHELNRQYLDHDWPTDVLSFVLDDSSNRLEGEVIISAETAAEAAAELGCSAAAEQLLYVIHGMLHLVGYRDKTASDAEEMRAAEARFLRQFGFEPTSSADDIAHAAIVPDDKHSPNGAPTP